MSSCRVASLHWRLAGPCTAAHRISMAALDAAATGSSEIGMAAVAHLSRYRGVSRVHTESDLRQFFDWCQARQLPRLLHRPHHPRHPFDGGGCRPALTFLRPQAADVRRRSLRVAGSADYRFMHMPTGSCPQRHARDSTPHPRGRPQGAGRNSAEHLPQGLGCPHPGLGAPRTTSM